VGDGNAEIKLQNVTLPRQGRKIKDVVPARRNSAILTLDI
jgi:hypothetical protein